MQAVQTTQKMFQPKQFEYTPCMNNYSHMLENKKEEELLVTLVRIFNFLEKDIRLLFDNSIEHKEEVKNQKIEIKKDLAAELATKADIEEIKGDFKELRGEFKGLKGEFKGLKDEFKLQIQAYAAATEVKLKEFEKQIQTQASKTEIQFKELERQIQINTANTDIQIEEIKGEFKSIRMLIKFLIVTIMIGISLFSPNILELSKFLGKILVK